ncbi:MAG TPA: PIN domain-containing protein [Verrucomicrobiae bacterium]|jgi:hypothetical protein
MTRTFLDSGVLLTGWKGRDPDRDKAIAVMTDVGREFVSSQIVRLELLPKSLFFKNRAEIAFYESYFDRLKGEEYLSMDLGDEAMDLGAQHGLAAGDALNLAAAIRLGASEFITTELPGRPMFRVKSTHVLSLHAALIN